MNSIRALCACLAAAVLARAAPPAAAEPVTFTFGGTVTRLEIDPNSPGPPPPWDSIAPSDPWSMAFTFESTTPNTSPLPTEGTYLGAMTSFTFMIGDEFVSTAPEETGIGVLDSVEPGDQYASFISFTDLVWALDLRDEQGVALASTDLPSERLDLEAFVTLREFWFGAGSGGFEAWSGEWRWIGDVTFHDVIPQPDLSISCPPDVELSCGAPSDPSSTGTATGSSNTVVTYTDATAPSLCASLRSIERTWIATDVEGNAVSCVQTILFVDSVAPLITCPPDVEVACGGAADPISTGIATATDVEDPAPAVTFSDAETPSECPDAPSLEREWSATDASGNSATCIQTIAFVDCGLSLLPEVLAFLDALDTTPLFGDMTGLLRGQNEWRKQELIAHALATRALLESGDRAGALDPLAWMRERMDGELLGLLDWVKGPAAAEGRARIDRIVGEVEDCGL
jgi:hypothetical protein